MLSGHPEPLGATWDGSGVNFAIASERATGVELCLFDSPADTRERTRLPLTARTGHVFHGYVPGLRPGQLYGYRVEGAWDPARGQRFNAAKVVLDPYARAIGRAAVWHPALLAYAPGSDGDGPADPTDSAPYAPLGAVLDPAFDWRGDRPPRTPWPATVIYELHVKGFSAQNPAVPPEWRGTYLGVAAPASIDHLRALGVTTVELLPIHAHANEPALEKRGLTNYWGYNTVGYLAPEPTYATAPHFAVTEFKQMVARLHAAGLEVILDVVYNHTADTDHLGPTLSLRGLDNSGYYRLRPGNPARYEDFTGCGNTLDTRSADARRLVLDSLRYWVADMHVDGFRFDLAPALARDPVTPDRLEAFFDLIADDPVLRVAKLIVEPWDAAPGGYQLGNFPNEWSEWNDRYRNTVRRFWRGDAGALPELATRLAGSRDVFGRAGRSPRSSINYVTTHDGFTLADLVAYNEKHNEANGEENRDGEPRNFSWNCGVEGPTDDPAILELRERQRRNFVLTLFVSLGVPMLSGGDELGRSQSGNNNAYCHDSPFTWTSWPDDPASREFLAFVRQAAALRASEPALTRDAFLDGPSGGVTDVRWLHPDGREMGGEDWGDPERRVLAVELRDTVLMLFNASVADVPFTLPATRGWRVRLATTGAAGPTDTLPAGALLTVSARSMAVLTALQ
ncbi:MAG TPA: glycogen debranching protein GlgX [Vicinamibacterales bacterium]|nr:glycogen debranching protein GlgX [Vicinamibacterales bacterium]